MKNEVVLVNEKDEVLGTLEKLAAHKMVGNFIGRFRFLFLIRRVKCCCKNGRAANIIAQIYGLTRVVVTLI